MAGGLSIAMWYEALGSAAGVVVKTDNRDLCVQKLYALRRKAADPDLDCIGIVLPPTSADEIWLVKKAPNNET